MDGVRGHVLDSAGVDVLYKVGSFIRVLKLGIVRNQYYPRCMKHAVFPTSQKSSQYKTGHEAFVVGD